MFLKFSKNIQTYLPPPQPWKKANKSYLGYVKQKSIHLLAENNAFAWGGSNILVP